jgi:hypothetical protein
MKNGDMNYGYSLLVVHIHFLLEEVFVVSSYVNTAFSYDVEVLSSQEDLMLPSFDEGRYASASRQSSSGCSCQWHTGLMSLRWCRETRSIAQL